LLAIESESIINRRASAGALVRFLSLAIGESMTAGTEFEMPKAYNPHSAEQRLYARWEESGAFAPSGRPGRPSFTIIMPPPNVTGDLHLGHALTDTIEDTLVRWHRMMGDRTLWLPGVDHAGIATQTVVERELSREGLTRHDIGREEFVERVWQWVERTRRNISNQHRRLGDSCDWSREVFTLDPGPALAVRTTFKRLYDDGLIYRGERIINWCPRCRTALSDLEVDYEDEPGGLWYIRYPLIDSEGHESGEFITMATTRPETIVGDTGVAVGTDDPRFRHQVGQRARLPIIGRELPIVADEAIDPSFGSGALKVTPGHDPVDFEIGERHGLLVVNVMNLDGTMNENAGPFAGLDRFAARDEIVKVLDGSNLLVKQEPYTHAIGHCQRCGTIVEPLVSEQWFVRIQPLAEPALEAVRDGRISIVPEFFAKTYENWMTNIRDWCISRQLWWGHRIPAWYCDACDEVVVDIEDPTACTKCGGELRQDEDVLDTWFSSGLWPFSTLGWPLQTDDLRNFYPTSVMETGYDILFFWVARMIMLGLYDTGDIPFRHVYLHGLVRDQNGQKMSKTRGNALDPLELIDQYGTDALRFALATGSTPGIDMRLQPDKLENGRNFANKLWNAARFVIMKLDGRPAPELQPREAQLPLEDRWILSRTGAVTENVSKLLADFQLGEAGRQLYDFIWTEYCDWYIELAKVRLNSGDAGALAVLVEVLRRGLTLLHPLMPFVTEAIWEHLSPLLPDRGPELLISAAWPEVDESTNAPDAERTMATIMDVIRSIRNVRAEKDVRSDRWINAAIVVPDAGLRSSFERLQNAIGQLAHANPVRILSAAGESDRDAAISVVLTGAEILLPMAGLFDRANERSRLEKQLVEIEAELLRLEKQLTNEAFRSRAPANIVAGIEEKRAGARDRMEGLKRSLAELA
jgi:valyl-tRNA synthetase